MAFTIKNPTPVLTHFDNLHSTSFQRLPIEIKWKYKDYFLFFSCEFPKGMPRTRPSLSQDILCLLRNPVYDSPLSLPPMFYTHICWTFYILEKYILSTINTVFYRPTYYSAGNVTFDVTP